MYSSNTSSFHFNFERSWPFQQVVLPVLLRLGVSKSPKIQAQNTNIPPHITARCPLEQVNPLRIVIGYSTASCLEKAVS
jgi:hypothetical protein